MYISTVKKQSDTNSKKIMTNVLKCTHGLASGYNILQDAVYQNTEIALQYFALKLH